jgi:hypothetical protein
MYNEVPLLFDAFSRSSMSGASLMDAPRLGLKVVLGGGQSGRGQFEGTDERPTQRHLPRRVPCISHGYDEKMYVVAAKFH